MTEPLTEHELGGTRPESRSELDEAQAWIEWGQGLAQLGASFSRLLKAEASLAFGDLRRLALLTLLLLPLACFAWLGLSVLAAWLAYLMTETATAGVITFFLVQCAALLLMRVLARRYSRSLGLPHTRAHIRAILEGLDQYGTTSTDRTDNAG